VFLCLRLSCHESISLMRRRLLFFQVVGSLLSPRDPVVFTPRCSASQFLLFFTLFDRNGGSFIFYNRVVDAHSFSLFLPSLVISSLPPTTSQSYAFFLGNFPQFLLYRNGGAYFFFFHSFRLPLCSSPFPFSPFMILV